MAVLAAISPDGLPPLIASAVIVASFFTSALTASFGLGGGLALLALMSAVLPAPAVIPVHGVAQLGSNASRFVLQWRDVVWPIILWFALGSLLGAAVGGRVYVALPEWLLKGAVGAFVLFTVWGPKPRAFSPGPASFFATGAVGAFLSMFFGATGPIAATMLSVARLQKLQTVATHAAAMVFQHGLKTLTFGFLGFAYREWAALIAAVVVAGFLGAWSGTRLLKRMPEETFKNGFQAVLTAFGVYLIGAAIWSVVRSA
ncbi:MAG: sulfite exporter TauE/SafE family protein [Parvularculaceae bacterium]